jgi:hypothetical protein
MWGIMTKKMETIMNFKKVFLSLATIGVLAAGTGCEQVVNMGLETYGTLRGDPATIMASDKPSWFQTLQTKDPELFKPGMTTKMVIHKTFGDFVPKVMKGQKTETWTFLKVVKTQDGVLQGHYVQFNFFRKGLAETEFKAWNMNATDEYGTKLDKPEVDVIVDNKE